MNHTVLALLVFICCQPALATAPTLSFHSYNHETKYLYMNIVTPTLHGGAFLKNGTALVRLRPLSLNDIFLLKVKVSCIELSKKNTTLIWKTKSFQLESNIPPQTCKKNARIIKENGKCTIDMNGTTLWRTALMLTKINHATVYQNMYALYLENKNHFVEGDISKLMVTILSCPSSEKYKMVTPEHAKVLFQDAMEFKKEM